MLQTVFESIERASRSTARFVPESLRENAESTRRAQLFVAFSILGVFFGMLFGGFYVVIGHPWGAAIVFACMAALAGAPWIVQRSGLEIAGNVYAGVLVLGFTGLTAIEGGIHGHAVAWLAVVPLCACLLVGQRACWCWCAVCLGVVLVFCALDLTGEHLPALFPAKWESTITAAGYLSLATFMSLLGLSFENGRRRSLEKLQSALEALSAANGRLQELNQERSEFLGIAAHDLRNPLSSIVGFAQLIQRYGPPMNDMQSDALTRILNASGRMRDLLDRLLSVRAIEDGKFELKMEKCDLSALAQAAVANHRIAAEAKGIALAFVPADGAAIVTADAAAVGQIIDNLLSNAIKFSPPGRPVIVSTTPAGEEGCRIEVKDAGPGLSEEDQGKLYGKFARLSARPTAGESSNGLGLSIVKRLAEAMDGTLACQSALGVGTTFSLTLNAPPVAGASAPPARAKSSAVELATA